MHRGFIKVWRKLDDWEWTDHLETVGFFVKLIMKANWKDKKWRGLLIKRGSFVTSYASLAEQFEITMRQARTLVDRLKATGELTVKMSGSYPVYTIVNYEQYQSSEIEMTDLASDTVSDQWQTNDTQNGRPTTTTKELKELKEDNSSAKAEPQTSLIPVLSTIGKKKRGDGPKWPPETNSLVKHFADTYKTATGQTYAVVWPKEMNRLGPIVGALGAEEVRRRIDLFFKANDSFLNSAGRDLGIFISQVNKLVSKIEENKNGRLKSNVSKINEMFGNVSGRLEDSGNKNSGSIPKLLG